MKVYKEVINRYKKKMLRLDHVVGVGYGIKEKHGKKTGEKAIVILVDKKLPPEKLRKKDLVPQSLGDYKTDVIEVGELNFLQLRTNRMRPAQPGVSIGHYKISAGTLGAIVKDRKTGEPLILSNNHVLANITNGHDGRAELGDPILQPGAYDDGSRPDDVIGRLKRFVPVKRGSGEPQCSVAIAARNVINFLIHLIKPTYSVKLLKEEGSNLVDCAVAKPNSSKDVKASILEIGEVRGVKEPEVGMEVQKSGRTSGLTRGEVLAVGVTVEVNMSESEVAVFNDQFITEAISKPGDSGSLVLDMENNAIGLLFAGSEKATVCNRITNVLNQLEVTF
ncbi:MAG: hypothetical protein PWR10_1497 [Halanaerobiales bacterium]|nr:hypothetical protein [Halanaerobiales bacterium]